MLKILKVLHLYQYRTSDIHPARARVDILLDTQQFANFLFQWAHDLCSRLQVLVCGHSDRIVSDFVESVSCTAMEGN